ncbi:MAG: hypothetical protein J7K72_02760 [Candidatus Aenigmarchaeota archaeon]|nr:hypothetical protein [Candidatus Aenigmarchaeota archaeon]
MDISKEILKNKTLLIILDEEQYEKKIGDVLRSLGKLHKKVCYVCLNKPYKDVMEDLKKQKVNINNFFFIDVLSSYYHDRKSSRNCVFIHTPTDFISIINALVKAVKEKGCEVVVFDTISTFLIYKQNYVILKFTHKVLENLKGDSRNVLITIKGGDLLNEEREKLIKDLMMFANMSISLETKKKEKILLDQNQLNIM